MSDTNIIEMINAKLKEFKTFIDNNISAENTPLYKLFILGIYIFKYEPNDKVNILLLYIFKIFSIIIILIMPLTLAIYTFIVMSNISSKNKVYWWSDYKYNYNNCKYDYLRQIYKIFTNVVLSERIIVYLFSSILLIIILIIIKIKFSDIILGNDNPDTSNYPQILKKMLFYNSAFFILIFIIIIIYLVLNYRKYNRVYDSNKKINNVYLKYLNKEYIQIICNNFIDEDNILNNVCNIRKLPSKKDLNNYLKTLEINKLKNDDVDLDNDKLNNYSNNQAKKFISALITHQWLIFIYNSQFTKIEKDNKMCRELTIDTIMNEKMYNIFYCYPEIQHFPFTSDVEGNILEKDAASKYFVDNYEIFTKIIDKYININNEMAKNISQIKKENINEINILIIIIILFILWTIGFCIL